MDYKAWVIPQDSLAISLELSDFYQVFYFKFFNFPLFFFKKKKKYPYYELLPNEKTKENLMKICEKIKSEATDGLDFMALLTTSTL